MGLFEIMSLWILLEMASKTWIELILNKKSFLDRSETVFFKEKCHYFFWKKMVLGNDHKSFHPMLLTLSMPRSKPYMFLNCEKSDTNGFFFLFPSPRFLWYLFRLLAHIAATAFSLIKPLLFSYYPTTN